MAQGNRWTYSGSDGNGIIGDGLKNYEPVRLFDIDRLPSILKELYSLASMTGTDFITSFIDRYKNRSDNVITMVKPSGFHPDNFISEILIPMIAVKYLGVLTAEMESNFNACNLLSVSLIPQTLPQPITNFKYVLEKKELALAQPGTVRTFTGTTFQTRMEMLVSLRPYCFTVHIPQLEVLTRANRFELLNEINLTLISCTETWKASIARLHYEYVASQPKASELLIQHAEYKKKYLSRGRCRLGSLLDIINIENTLEGALNRDVMAFSSLATACTNMIRDQGNNHVLIVPKRLMPEDAGACCVLSVPYSDATYQYTTSGVDSNNQVIDIMWSKNLVSDQLISTLTKHHPYAQLDGGMNKFYSIIQSNNDEKSMLVPGVRIGKDSYIPTIVLDDTQFSTDGPSMQDPLVRRSTKRYFYTVGAIPPSYTNLKSQLFYNNMSEINMATVAAKSPGISYIVNYEEQASITEVRLRDLHRIANVEQVFDWRSFVFDYAGMPQLSENRQGRYITAIEAAYADSTTNKLNCMECTYEFSPRNATFPILHVNQDEDADRVRIETRPRMCMWNSSYMNGIETEFVGVLASIWQHLGTSDALLSYLKLCHDGFANTGELSIAFLILARILMRTPLTADKLRQTFQLAKSKDDASINFTKLILQMLQHIIDTVGATLCIADPYAMLCVIRIINYITEIADEFKHNDDEFDLTIFFDPTNIGNLNNLKSKLLVGMSEFTKTITRLGVTLINHDAMPYRIINNGLKLTNLEEQFCNLFINCFAAIVCTSEIVIRQTDDVIDDIELCCTHTNRRAPSSYLFDYMYTTHYDPISGTFNDTGEARLISINNPLYRNSFFCRGGGHFCHSANIFLGTIRYNQFGNVNDFTPVENGSILQIFDVTPYRLMVNYVDLYPTIFDMNRHNIQQPFVVFNEPFQGIIQPMWLVRKTTISKELDRHPLLAFYMALHFYTNISYQNVISNFDKNYYSGWSYLCVRTMTFDGYSMAAMPMRGSIFVTGNRTLVNMSTNPTTYALNSSIEMAVMPGHMGSHGVVFPNVFITNPSGINSIFITPHDIYDSTTTIGREKRRAAIENMTIVLDWYSSMLPETMSGLQKTCESILPVNGRYISAAPVEHVTEHNYYTTPDPMTNHFVESPTLMPISDSLRILRILQRQLKTDGITQTPIDSFIDAGLVYDIADGMPGVEMFNDNDETYRTAILTRAIALRGLETPFITKLGLMFADSYVVGAGGGVYLMRPYNSSPCAELKLNPRIIGEGLTPTHLFSPETSKHFLSRFTRIINTPFTSGFNAKAGTVVDSTVLSGIKSTP